MEKYSEMKSGKVYSRKKNILIAFLVIALLASLGYIGYIKYQEREQSKLAQAYNIGVQDGLGMAIVELMKKSSNCQVVTLRYGEQTTNLVSTECVQSPATVPNFLSSPLQEVPSLTNLSNK